MNYNKNDFKLEWYSGQSAGGQHRKVHDKESGLKMPYKDVVLKKNIGPMIEARLKSKD